MAPSSSLRPRAAVIVTGTEVLGGWVSDRNGPWLAKQLGSIGVEHVTTITVGDRADDLLQALRNARSQGCNLIITSGGLGPTEDDLTAATVAEFADLPHELDSELEERIWQRIEGFVRNRWPDVDADTLRAANRKQGFVPRGAQVIEPVGTAPGLVVPVAETADGHATTVLVLPGPPRELIPMWKSAQQLSYFQTAIAGADLKTEQILRVYGAPEADLMEAMSQARANGVDLDRLEITTCAHSGELEIVTRIEAGDEEVFEGFKGALAERYRKELFSQDGRTVVQIVTDLLLAGGHTVATAESCTGGLIATKLTDAPGSSRIFAGSVVSYADSAKVAALGVDEGLLAEHGAVSREVAEAMATGAVERFGVDFAVSVTGIAGPDGGTEEKPVGTIFIAVANRDRILISRRADLFGDRASIRDRTTTAALHLLRRALLGEHDAPRA